MKIFDLVFLLEEPVCKGQTYRNPHSLEMWYPATLKYLRISVPQAIGLTQVLPFACIY